MPTEVRNDDTRDEIVRLARKGWSAGQIAKSITELATIHGPKLRWTACTEEQVQQVIDEVESATKQRGSPVYERDLKALNERVTELRRKMPDDEPCTILARLHENGEFLWADEAHIEGALLRLEEQQADATGRIAKWLDEAREMGYGSRDIARMLGEVYVGPAPGRAAGSVEELADLLDETANGQAASPSEPTLEQLQDQARELFDQAYKLAEKAKGLVAPTEEEWDGAWRMVNEMMSDCSNDYPNTGTADGLWDVIDQVLETRREAEEEAEEGQSA